jgi:hypothetical protein
MYKALCIAALLVPTVLSAQDSKSASAPTLPGPVVVARGKVVNRNTVVPTTAIFTPKQTGLYRLSVYGTITTVDINSMSSWYYNFGWTDDAGAQIATEMLIGSGNTFGTFAGFDFVAGGASYPFEAKAGTAVTYSIVQNGPPDGSVYSLYYTVEQLQ